MVVDDEDAARYSRVRILSQAGFQVQEAATGATALRAIALNKPALVVLDVNLPDISGIDVCRTIKRTLPETLVLQTSAVFMGAADRVRGLETGADAYLIEPIERRELVANVHALLRLRSARQQWPQPDVSASSREVDLLVKEVYHHTKNDFQLAVSLLSIQSHRSSDPPVRQALNEAMGRLRAMAHVHELLYRASGAVSVDCADLIRAICTPSHGIHSPSGTRIQLELEPFVCRRHTAVRLALIANEVITNALKYAFPSGGGTVLIQLAKGAGKIALTIKDDGIGQDASPLGSSGFGKQLISTLARELNASEFLYEHGTDGTVFRLVLTY